MYPNLPRLLSGAGAAVLLLATQAAIAECRAPTACISCHTANNIPPAAAVLQQMGAASCEVGDFTRGLNMTVPRFIHRTAKLNDGRVLLTGGQIQNAPASVITNSVDAFNPADNSITPVAPMTIRRWSHTATTLADGRVLVTGGRTNSTAATGIVLATAEVYDPATNTWTETAGPMNVARRSHTATLLANGKVLIAGGGNGVSTTTSQAIQSAELFDPVTGMFTLIGNMLDRRSAHSAILLDDGKVLISGGSNGIGTLFPVNTAELYDPATNTFTPTGNMNYPHLAQLPGKLRDGRVVQGSSYYNTSHTSAGGRITDESEIYNPVTESWTPVAPMFKQRIDIGAQGLLDGTLLVAGGVTTSPNFPSIFQPTSEVFDPATMSWKLSGIMSAGRDEFSGLLLDDGRVMISGGFLSPGAVLLKSVEVYTPGLVPQHNGFFNVVGDLPATAFHGGENGRDAVYDKLLAFGEKLNLYENDDTADGEGDDDGTDVLESKDYVQALAAAGRLRDMINRKVIDPRARTKLLSMVTVLTNTLNEKISPNLAPTATPTGAPSAGVEPLSVQFAANALDGDGTIVSTQWSFGDFTTSTAANPTHVYQCDGTYTATVEVVDNRGAVASGSVTITVSAGAGGVSYACDVQPVFNRVCTGCHGAARGLSLTTCENLQLGSNPRPRPVVTPGVKETSLLWQRINSTTAPMPPIGGQLPAAEINAIGTWIDGLDPTDANFCD
jgi:PKD repeat protein